MARICLGILLLYSFVLVWAEEKSLTGNKDFNIDDRQFQICRHITPFSQPCPCYCAGCGCLNNFCDLNTGQCGLITPLPTFPTLPPTCPCHTNKIIVENSASFTLTPELCAASCTGSCKVTTKI